jgi:hypothetical protein
MTSQLARFVVVSVWLGLMVALWQGTDGDGDRSSSTLLPESGPSAALDDAGPAAWVGLYMDGKKVGYANYEISPRPGGYLLSDRSVLRLRMMDTNQTVHAHTVAQTDATYALSSFRVRLQSGIGDFQVSGAVEGATLTVTMVMGTQSDTRRFPLDGPIFLPSALRARLVADGLRVGAKRSAAIFDPAAMAAEPITIETVAREKIDSHDGPIEAWRLVESFRGIESTVWLDAGGRMLREEGPMGLVAVRESAERATGDGWGDGSLVDLMDAVAVPVAVPIAEPRRLARLRLRVAGLGGLQPPNDGRQRFAGAALDVERETLAGADTFHLPYAAADMAAELAGTAFVQSEHPRLREAAAEILGDESDARAAAVRLRRWVYDNIRKQPVASIPNALQVLEMRTGDCNEHAVLFAALARAAGLPARIAAGVVYSEGVFLYHAWNEVWLGRQWVSVDAAFDQMPADATHIKLVEGEPDRHVELVPIIGKLSLEVLEAG